jgi:hypothetical protein
MDSSHISMPVRRAGQRHHRNRRTLYGPRRRSASSRISTMLLVSTLFHVPTAQAVTMLPLRVTNNCKEPIWPGILTQGGVPPESSGFLLQPGETKAQTVGIDWKGRVWPRTNCSFPTDGSVPASGQGGAPCETGDCGMFLECQGAVGDFRI